MKRLRIPFEYLVLGIVIVALVIYLIMRNPNRIQYEIPEMDSLAREGIHKIEMDFSGRAITLEQVDSSWLIQPQAYPADADKVQKVIDTIVGLRLTDVISESENYIKYGLDPEKKISVRVYDRKKLIRAFEIGSQAATYRHTFVKIESDKRVFHAENSFRTHFEQTVDELRDKSVLRLDAGEIQAMELVKGDRIIRLKKTIVKVEPKTGDALPEKPAAVISPSPEIPPGEPEVWLTPEGIKAKKTEVDSLLADLADLKCQSFIEGKTRDDFPNPVFRININLRNGRSYDLNIFEKRSEKDDAYPAVSSESPYPFNLSTYAAEQFMKKTEDILQGSEAEAENTD